MDLNAILEHDYEPAPGLPEVLPHNERLLWQGKSDFRSIARWTFHVRKLAAYFAALLAIRLLLQLASGADFIAALGAGTGLAALAVVALGVLHLYSYLIAKSTLFTITNKRIIIRAGVAVPVTINLPFSKVESADLRLHSDGTGDIAILTEAESRVSYVLLWPYVKPWRFMRVRPVLRAVANAEAIASLLANALTGSVSRVSHTAAGVGAEAKVRPALTTDEQQPRRNWLAYPTFPLASAASLVVVALITVAMLQLADRDNDAPRATQDIVAEIQLYFRDRDDGAVVVVDALSGNTIEVLEPGTNGFLRSTMRTFVRERKAVQVGNETPFALQQTESGRLLLTDPATGREVDLWAFGKTNAEAFRRFLVSNLPQAVATTSQQITVPPGNSAVAHIIQETSQ